MSELASDGEAARPRSIVRFERLYLLGFALSLVGWAVAWNTLEARLTADPRTASSPLLWWMLPAALAISVAITLGLWWLTARRASRLGKWLVAASAVLFGLRLLFNLPVLLGGRVPLVEAVLSVVTTALTIAAAIQLFASDARVWFGEPLEPAEEEEVA